MTTLVVLLAFGLMSPQEPAAAPAAAAPAAAAVVDAAAKTVEATASPEIVGQMVKDLGITPAQAEGAAGAMLGLAKTKLPAADFAQVASAVPNIDGLLKAAPAAPASGKASAAALAAGALGVGGMSSLAPSLAKLALKPEVMAKLAPSLIKAVGVKGGASTAALLAGALK